MFKIVLLTVFCVSLVASQANKEENSSTSQSEKFGAFNGRMLASLDRTRSELDQLNLLQNLLSSFMKQDALAHSSLAKRQATENKPKEPKEPKEQPNKSKVNHDYHVYGSLVKRQTIEDKPKEPKEQPKEQPKTSCCG